MAGAPVFTSMDPTQKALALGWCAMGPLATMAGRLGGRGCASSIQFTHSLKGAWFQTLNLTCDLLFSKFAFKWVNLYRYTESRRLGSWRTARTR
jgi:hypothetical protein